MRARARSFVSIIFRLCHDLLLSLSYSENIVSRREKETMYNTCFMANRKFANLTRRSGAGVSYFAPYALTFALRYTAGYYYLQDFMEPNLLNYRERERAELYIIFKKKTKTVVVKFCHWFDDVCYMCEGSLYSFECNFAKKLKCIYNFRKVRCPK